MCSFFTRPMPTSIKIGLSATFIFAAFKTFGYIVHTLNLSARNQLVLCAFTGAIALGSFGIGVYFGDSLRNTEQEFPPALVV